MREPEFWLVFALAAAIYLPRITQISMRGEESRRAQVAAEILRTGDWVVPRQQGEIYLSRPPVGSWPMAALALARGELDLISVRLPTALATIGTCLAIYLYARGWLGKLGAMAAGVAYATMAQVLELGMVAETESSLTLLVTASLFFWHGRYASGRVSAWTWAASYALAALAGLTKGPQGPVYFVAVTAAYLWFQRDFRAWLSWRHAIGLLTMLSIIGVWQALFTLRTDWLSSVEIWTHNASDRFVESSWGTFFTHLAKYPLEVAACTLPWSLMLIAYAYPRVRARLDHTAPLVKFMVVALVVTFPSCWLAATARGRYFMPLYPCMAVLIGVAIDRIVQLAQDAQLSYAIQRFLWPCAVALPLGAVVLLFVDLTDGNATRAWTAASDSPLMSVAFTLVATFGGWLVARAAREVSPERVRWGLLAIAGFIGFTYMGPIANVRIASSEDTARLVAELKRQLPQAARGNLVSVGRVHHLFAYYYGEPIRVLPPEDLDAALREQWEYFCVDQPGAQAPELPFKWERLALVSCERNRVKNPEQKVLIGRRVNNDAHTAGRGEDHDRK